MKQYVLFFSICCLTFLYSCVDAKYDFPLFSDWIKRSQKNEGCTDPTEPFQCPGSNICISLQFLCDGQPNDCPNNFDENQGLCVAGMYLNFYLVYFLF